MRINPRYLLTILAIVLVASCRSPTAEPGEAALAQFHPVAAPPASTLLLRPGDRLAICGDSITEQKMYSRLIEDYLTMCVPQLGVSVRQYGWGGERTGGFRARMTNDCLRFQPTLATTCYGMNDHEYRPYEERIGRTYRDESRAVVQAFKAHGARVVLGSPGCVGKVPRWTRFTNSTVLDLNLNLCTLRNIALEVAQQEQVAFADVFWPMLTADAAARKRFGPDFAVAGRDGVHPDWAGHGIMAYAFLKALGLRGDLATFTVDLRRNTLQTSEGHTVLDTRPGAFVIRSTRYPFCVCAPAGAAAAGYPECGPDDLGKDSSLRAGLSLVPFDAELNRFLLVAKNTRAARYRVTWGSETRSFTAAQLRRGINLAAEFRLNPFSAPFARVDGAVAAKQAFETKQVKQIFHGAEGKSDFAGAVARTEAERASLVEAIKAAFQPVTHTLAIAPE